jgi:hypothetical protein
MNSIINTLIVYTKYINNFYVVQNLLDLRNQYSNLSHIVLHYIDMKPASNQMIEDLRVKVCG